MGDGAALTGRAGRREWLCALAIALLALGLRWAVILEVEAHHPSAAHPAIDEASYVEWGLRVAGGDLLGEGVFFQEPLYPYLLGGLFRLLGPEPGGPRRFQALLGAFACLLVWRLGRRAFGPAAGLVAASLLAVHGPAALMVAWLLKPSLLLVLLGALALLVPAEAGTARRWFAVGLCAGLGSLVRGNVLLLTPLLVLWPWLRARKARGERPGATRRSLAVLAGVVLTLLPVALRNFAVGGEFVLTTSGPGTNLFGGNSLENPRGVATELPFVRGIPRYEADDWRREAERRSGRALSPQEVSRYWLAETWRSVRAHPREHLAILWRKLRRTLGRYEIPDNHAYDWDARYVPLLAWLPGFAPAGTLGIAGLLLAAVHLARRRRGGPLECAAPGPPFERRPAVELALLFALYLATIVLTVTSARIRLGLLPWLLPFSGWAAVALARGLAGRGPRLAPLVALALGALCVLPPAVGEQEREADLDERDLNLAVQLLENESDVDGAERIARCLEQRRPQSARVQTLLASIEWRRGASAHREPGRRAEAEALFDRALARLKEVAGAPGVAPREAMRARKLAGWIQLTLGNAAAAERHFTAAAEFAPDDPEVALGRAQALVALAEGASGERRADLERRAREVLGTLEGVRGWEAAVADLAGRLAALR